MRTNATYLLEGVEKKEYRKVCLTKKQVLTIARFERVVKSQVTKVVQHVEKCMERFNQKPTTPETDHLCTLMYRELVGSEVREEQLALGTTLGVDLHEPNTLLWLMYEYQISSLLRTGLPVDQELSTSR